MKNYLIDNGIIENFHFWRSNGLWLLSDESIKKITSHKTMDNVINYLYLIGYKEIARRLNDEYSLVKVKFIKEFNEYTKEYDILAVFPYEFTNIEKTQISCYSHIGQHGSADINYIKHKRKAPRADYLPLLKELQLRGYKNLTVINKE